VAPVLDQVGPFVFTETTKRWNIWYTSEQPARVDWDQLVFTELLPERSCAACQLNATVRVVAQRAAKRRSNNTHAPALAFASYSAQTRPTPPSCPSSTGTRAPYYSPSCRRVDRPHCAHRSTHALPLQTALESLLNALQQILASIASQPSLVSIFPGVVGPLATGALKQWASCGALGMPVLALGNDAISSMLPHAPEFCAWAQGVMGASRSDASLPLDVANNFLATLRASASPGVLHARPS